MEKQITADHLTWERLKAIWILLQDTYWKDFFGDDPDRWHAVVLQWIVNILMYEKRIDE